MKSFLRIMFGAIALIILSGQWLTVNAQEMQLPPIPVDPAVRIGHLDNGLTYYIRHNEKPENRVEYRSKGGFHPRGAPPAWFGTLPGAHGLQWHKEFPW